MNNALFVQTKLNIQIEKRTMSARAVTKMIPKTMKLIPVLATADGTNSKQLIMKTHNS